MKILGKRVWYGSQVIYIVEQLDEEAPPMLVEIVGLIPTSTAK